MDGEVCRNAESRRFETRPISTVHVVIKSSRYVAHRYHLFDHMGQQKHFLLVVFTSEHRINGFVPFLYKAFDQNASGVDMKNSPARYKNSK